MIDKQELSSKIALLKNASLGKISEPIMEMADAGSSTFYGLKYNETSKSYHRILLKQIGDLRIDNSSVESIELWNWLTTIQNKISQ
ncbi:MAG: hypothetical protein PHV20_11735 [Bacteroidales bacterium]|nr:hypothetical protein [Bacteroidales bacterium]